MNWNYFFTVFLHDKSIVLLSLKRPKYRTFTTQKCRTFVVLESYFWNNKKCATWSVKFTTILQKTHNKSAVLPTILRTFTHFWFKGIPSSFSFITGAKLENFQIFPGFSQSVGYHFSQFGLFCRRFRSTSQIYTMTKAKSISGKDSFYCNSHFSVFQKWQFTRNVCSKIQRKNDFTRLNLFR
jgi:hypothetical protein